MCDILSLYSNLLFRQQPTTKARTRYSKAPQRLVEAGQRLQDERLVEAVVVHEHVSSSPWKLLIPDSGDLVTSLYLIGRG
jgi:hypothetical protein